MMSNKGVTPITQSTHVRNVKKGDRSKLIFVPLEIIIFTIYGSIVYNRFIEYIHQNFLKVVVNVIIID